MKKVLIISPFFPPVNGADMHRVRQSISYYKENGWEAEVVVVDPNLIDIHKDKLLIKTLPRDIVVHKVKAFDAAITQKIGLGSIAYRSMYYYWKYVNNLLRKGKYDLIFFSTTAFQLCVLGRIWKSRFKVPYIIDMQDPWRSDYYLNLPKEKRPPKFWLSYRIDSFLESYSMHSVDGLMAVSQNYINVLLDRYPEIENIPTSVIPFAAYEKDLEVARNSELTNPFFNKNDGLIYMTYIGRGGHDMVIANRIILSAIKLGLSKYDLFQKIRLYFIGTSYDVSENAEKTIYPIAVELGIQSQVVEITRRIPYFQSLKVLSDSDILMVPGSIDPSYTASKIYGYVWMKKPMVTIFRSESSVNEFMENVHAGLALKFNLEEEVVLQEKLVEYIYKSLTQSEEIKIDKLAFEQYCSPAQVKKQVALFDKIVS